MRSEAPLPTASSVPRAVPTTVREALVEVVGADDYRTKKWDELVARLS